MSATKKLTRVERRIVLGNQVGDRIAVLATEIERLDAMKRRTRDDLVRFRLMKATNNLEWALSNLSRILDRLDEQDGGGGPF